MRDQNTSDWLNRLFGRNRGNERNGSEPLVSVILSTYNWSSVLRLAIETVLWQTMRRDFELLVVGDGCTDDSAEVVQSFGDARIRWHNLASNSGSQSGPDNAGLAMARGRYVAYLGHDDVWYPTHLATLVESTAKDRRRPRSHAVRHARAARKSHTVTDAARPVSGGPGNSAVYDHACA